MCMTYSLIGPQQILLQNSDSVNREKIVIISFTIHVHDTCTDPENFPGSWAGGSISYVMTIPLQV